MREIMKTYDLISKRVSRLAESPTLRLLAQVGALQAQGKKIFGFHIGEPDFDIPPNVAKAIKDAVDQGKTHYTHQAGLPELREAISQYYQSQFDLHFKIENIVATSGPKDTIFKLFGSIINPGDKVIVFDPHWEAYGEQVSFFDGHNVFVPRDKDNLSYRLDYLEDAIKQKPKALVLADPDNPTGYKANTEELKAIAELARKYHVVVLSDEIYCLHCYDTEFKSISHYYPEGTILLSGASKPWAGTGLRVGFALFPEELGDVASHVAKLTGQASSSVNTPAQYGIIEALVNPETRKWENEMVEEFRKRRDLVEEMIGSLLGYELGGAFYAAPKTPLHSEEFSKRLLEEEHVCVLPLSELSSGAHGYFDKRVRISYGTGIDLLEEGLARFRRFAEAIQS
jgi:aspartate/methionine/tyrosine aminotransferase